MNKLCLSFFFTIALVCPLHAHTWYVATTGNNANTCTQAQNVGTPKRTIAAGLACVGGAGTEAGAGHTVQVAAGTYNESLIDVIPSGSNMATQFRLNCVANLACTISQSGNTYGMGMDVASHWITVNGFRFTGGSGIYISGAGLGTHHDISITNNEFLNMPHGIAVQISGADSINFTGNSVHDTGSSPYTFPCGTGGYCVGVYIADRTRNFYISRNEIYSVSGYGIQIYGDTSDLPSNHTISGNIIRNNLAAAGMIVYGNGHQVYNNILYGNAFGGIILRASSAGVYFNTSYGNRNGGNEPFAGISDEGGGATCRNNIVYANTGGQLRCNTVSNNLTTDPSFVDVTKADFQLRPGSPAIDAGSPIPGVSDDFAGTPRGQGSGDDIGAFEYTSTSTAPRPPSNLRVVGGN